VIATVHWLTLERVAQIATVHRWPLTASVVLSNGLAPMCESRRVQTTACSFWPVRSPLNSGDVKGTITDAVRYHFVPNDVRRRRLISISYMSLLPCHGRGRRFESPHLKDRMQIT
jgi:hypothetical protein